MLSMLPNALAGAGLMVLVVLGWAAVLHVIRILQGLPPDCDVLADYGCAHCGEKARCTFNRPQRLP